MNISQRAIAQKPRTTTIFFTSDEHGYLGNASPIQHIINEAKEENPDGVFLVSSGDTWQSAPESELQGGRPGYEVINKAGYDIMELGNHDWDNGQEFLTEMVDGVGCPVLAGNVRTEEGTLYPGTKAHHIINAGGIKLGFYGVITQETPDVTPKENVEGITFEDPVKTAQESVNALKAEGADVIIGLSHCTDEEDARLSSQVDGDDFILGGHTHEMYREPRLHGENSTPVIKPGSARRAVGRLDLHFDAQGELKDSEYNLLEVGDDSPVDHDHFHHWVDDNIERVAQVTNTVVSFSEEKELPHSHTQPDILDDILASGMSKDTGAPVIMFNRKVIRTGHPGGAITAGQMKEMIPFPNEVVTVKLNPEEVTQALQKSADYNNQSSLHIEGLSYSFDDGVVSDVLMSDGSELPDELEVATTDFIANGGLKYFAKDDKSEFGLLRESLGKEFDRRLPPAMSHLKDITADDVMNSLG